MQKNMQKNVKIRTVNAKKIANMQQICNYMHKYAAQICTNMHNICQNIHKICTNMQNKYAKRYRNIDSLSKNIEKYATNMQIYAQICKKT